MNKFVRQQLLKVNIPLPDWDDETTHLVVSRNYSVKKEEFTIGGNYDIMIEDYIVNEPSNFTLSANWNNGTKPPEHKMFVCVDKVMGKMVHVEGMGATSKSTWGGWLPRKGFKVI